MKQRGFLVLMVIADILRRQGQQGDSESGARGGLTVGARTEGSDTGMETSEANCGWKKLHSISAH
jgi:hypothetical protein